jgi:hypothetical protein
MTTVVIRIILFLLFAVNCIYNSYRINQIIRNGENERSSRIKQLYTNIAVTTVAFVFLIMLTTFFNE